MHKCAQALGPHLCHPHMHTGLAKAEDKSRGYRAKKQEGPGPEDVRKKVPAPVNTVNKEVPAPVAHSTQGGGYCVVRHRLGLDCEMGG